MSHRRKYWITCSEVCRWRSQEETAISAKPWYNYKHLLIPNNIILKGDVSIGKLLANIYWAWGMTYCFSVRNDVVLGAIHTIPEWISSSIYFSVFVDMIPKWHSFSYKSFWNEFILVFNPNEFLIWYEISFLYQCKLKQTFFHSENHKSCSLVQVAHAYLIWHEHHVSENSLSWAGQFYHVNAVWTLLRNKTHSGMKVSQVSHKQPLEANFDACFSSLTWRC